MRLDEVIASPHRAQNAARERHRAMSATYVCLPARAGLPCAPAKISHISPFS
jgi:hypothetical protein